MAIDIIARGMIEESYGDISHLSEQIDSHTGNGNIHVTTVDKSKWNGYDAEINQNKSDISALYEITSSGETVDGKSSYTLTNVVDYPLVGLNLYGKSTQDGVPTPENPVEIVSVGDSGSVSVQACGKNLFEGSQDFSGEWVNANIWYTSNEKYNGLTVKYSTFAWNGIGQEFILNINTPYTVSFYAKTAKGQTLRAILATNPNGADYNTFNKRFTVTEEWERYTQTFICEEKSDVFIRVGAEASATAPLYVCGFQLEIGDTATAFEPYHGTTANITSALPLCGIPVDSDGNYTDSTGQQWICDELVYNADGTGKIVKNCMKTVFDGSDDESWSTIPLASTAPENSRRFYTSLTAFANATFAKWCGLCSSFKSINMDIGYLGKTQGIALGNDSVNVYFTGEILTVDEFKNYLQTNPFTVVYQCAEPQEIPLTAAEMTQLRQLQTFNGITNISNSDGADMDVKYCTNKVLSEYVIPITTVLQAQIDELKSAVLSLGGNI